MAYIFRICFEKFSHNWSAVHTYLIKAMSLLPSNPQSTGFQGEKIFFTVFPLWNMHPVAPTEDKNQQAQLKTQDPHVLLTASEFYQHKHLKQGCLTVKVVTVLSPKLALQILFTGSLPLAIQINPTALVSSSIHLRSPPSLPLSDCKKLSESLYIVSAV